MLHFPTPEPIPITMLPPGFKLRVVSPAACGFPSPAQDWEDEALNLVEILRLDSASAFVFRLAGSSMIEAGLFDGDLVIIDKGSRPRNGSIVIAVVEGGFVCRQFVVKQGVPYLEARNSRMTYPVCIADELVEIWGVIRASVRDLKP
ncbi:S24 family peptidase [Aureimonas sp. Leaf324]|uniref:LexA family protein n=1 Tax=Aureimonas sp. Leaf324 TaxID=1736336 RepID=UPI0006F86FF8|nr:S24 family peptidase [Aureimonas sp. Leaf324]KQQ90976.1 repressor [Aureimonas sp. Leaf324]